MLLWFFYDETGIPLEYKVSKNAIIYYFLFSVVIIPFLIFIDVLFLNVMQYFHECDFREYILSWGRRYRERNTDWIGMTDKNNPELEFSIRTLDKMCFCSQYYFIIGVYAFGFLFIVLGLIGMIKTNYVPFKDKLFPLILVSNFLVTLSVIRFFLWIQKKLKFWKAKQSQFDKHSSNPKILFA